MFRVVFHYTRIIYLRANFPEPGSTRERGYMVENTAFSTTSTRRSRTRRIRSDCGTRGGASLQHVFLLEFLVSYLVTV